MSPEIRERPIGFRHLGSSPFCEGESQTLKLPLTALFTQQTSVFGFVCSTKQKGLGTNLHLASVLAGVSLFFLVCRIFFCVAYFSVCRLLSVQSRGEKA